MKSKDLHDPATGSRLRWHLRSTDTDGQLARAELWLRAGWSATCHAEGGDQRLEVLGGELHLMVEAAPPGGFEEAVAQLFTTTEGGRR